MSALVASRCPISDLDFSDHLCLDIRMPRQQVESPCHGQRGGFVARKKDGHRFVAYLRVGHWLTVFIPRVHQGRQVIRAPLGAVYAPLLQKAVHHAVDLADCPEIAAVRWQWHPVGDQHRTPEPMRHFLEKKGERALHDLDFGFRIGIEHGARDDTEHQVHHVGMDVERGLVLPAIDLLPGERHDQRIVLLHAPGREMRRGEAALMLPEASVA
ncbi:MAG: hypothetical protein R8G60_07330 [Roseovarius pacificus]|nr:hypothetical protein [Roseovarius pacificus]